MGIRSTCVVRFVVNADKYTQGRLILSYRPASVYTDFTYRHDFRLQTQLTNVQLDLNTDTEVTLRIPHRGPYTHYDITNGRFDPGVFEIKELLPVRGNPFTYTIYHSFEDIDLMGPTAISIANYQSGLEAEADNVKLSTKVKNLASAMVPFGAVPVIGSYIAPMSWATAVAGNVLSAFGWSKPLETRTPEVFINRTNAKYNHCDGNDYAEQLAMTTTTGVRATDQIGLTKEDEMSFPFLVGINSAMYRFTTPITTQTGSKILTIPLCPYAMNAPIEPEGSKMVHPIAYIANLFNMYRGSFTVTFDLAKTIFHSGRMLVVFEPIVADGFGQPNRLWPSPRVETIDDAVNCHKDVVDIRKGSSFAFTFPFTSVTPYLPCEIPYGYVHVFVLNQPVRNDTQVADSIDVLVSVKGEEDFEFAGPTDPRLWPFRPLNSATNSAINDETGGNLPSTIPTVSYQSGLEVSDSVIVSKCIGTTSMPSMTTKMSELCIGEQIRSMKQVAMRMKRLNKPVASNVPNDLLRDPFFVDTLRGDQQPGVPDVTHSLHDFYSYVGCLYNYARGGVIVNIENHFSTQMIRMGYKTDCSHFFRERYGEEMALTGLIKPLSSERYYLPPYDQSIVRFTYTRNLFSDGNEQESSFPGLEYTAGVTAGRLTVTEGSDGELTRFFVMSRGAAEDTQFGGFIGTPRMVVRGAFGRVFPADDFKTIAWNDYGFPAS